MRRCNQINAFSVNTEKSNYIVTLERLKNGANGQPRYKAVVIALNSGPNDYFNAVYTFSGHYFKESEEAQFIVNEYERGLNNE